MKVYEGVLSGLDLDVGKTIQIVFKKGVTLIGIPAILNSF